MTQIASFSTPEDVEAAFYQAIQLGDADLLIQAWANDEETLCVHPTGVSLRGNPAICESWRAILGSAPLRIQSESVVRWQGSVMAVHQLTESLFIGDTPQAHGPLNVTHVFLRGPHGWHLVARHASAADATQPPPASSVKHTLH